jgi:exodeoxyribonuclease VII small subunit
MARKSKPEEQRFEQLMDRLEELVDQLESNELSLEEAIDAYQEGVQLAKLGHDRLAAAESRIEELTKSGKSKALDADEILGAEADV